MAINAGDKWENDRGGSRISDGGGGTKGGSANLSFGQIFQTLHKNEESGPAGGGEGGVQNVTMYIYHWIRQILWHDKRLTKLTAIFKGFIFSKDWVP